MMKNTLNSGQVIIEAVIALSALLVLLAAIAVVITTSLANTTFSNNQDVANKLAQEGIENIRSLAQSNATFTLGTQEGVSVFDLNAPYYCMGDEGEIQIDTGGVANPREGCGVNVEGGYVRTVKFVQDLCSNESFNGVEATVNVSWSSGKCQCEDVDNCSLDERYCHTAELVSCFADTDSGPTPVL